MTEREPTADPPPAIKRALIEQQIALWVNTAYDAKIRLRVQKAIGDTEQQAAIIKDMERCEKALDALAAELAALPDAGSV